MSYIFEKYHGLGNDYIVYDCNKNDMILSKEKIKLLCHRNYGLGADGILVGPIFENNKIKLIIYNPDGSRAEKSGNGVRVFSKYLKDAGYIKEKAFTLLTQGGEVEVQYLNEGGTYLRVSMGKLSFMSSDIGMTGEQREVINIPLKFYGKEYPCTCVSIGNPHCVIQLEEISKAKVCEIGQYSEVSDYFPKRINTQIVKIVDRNNIQIEIFERGAGYTLASGSSSCAAAGAMYRLGLVDNHIKVHMPGGVIEIDITEDMNVYMTGEVRSVARYQLTEEYVEDNNL